MGRLKERVALVTGVARTQGIGYGIAKVFAREGSVVVAADVSATVFERVKELQVSGYEAVGFKVDLASFKEVKEMVERVLEQFVKVDILVNVAGGALGLRKPFIELTKKEWDKVLNANLMTTFNCTKAVLPLMMRRHYGKIVNISSVTGPMVALTNMTHYSAAKGAVSGFTRALALEVAEYGINVNSICPGFIDTGLSTIRRATKLAKSIPLKRRGDPEEVGELALFLSSDGSKYLVGAEIIIDGGNIIQEEKFVE